MESLCKAIAEQFQVLRAELRQARIGFDGLAHNENENGHFRYCHHASSDPYEEVAYATTYADDGYTSSDEAFYEAMMLSVRSTPDIAEPLPPKQAIIRPSTRITRARKAKAAYDAMRKRRRRQSIAFARIMGQGNEDFAPPPASKRPIALVRSPRRAAIAKFDALLGAPPASKIVSDDPAEPLIAPDDSQPTRDGEPSQLCNHPAKPLLPVNPGEEASRFCDAIFRFLVQSMSMT